MATAEQLKALLAAHVERDDPRFLSVAMQVAASEARAGHTRLATELRELIDAAKEHGALAQQPRAPVPVVQPRGELAGVVTATYPKARIEDMVLEDQTRDRLVRVLHEYRQRQKLAEHGLSPRTRLLLVGPPGCGKTMTASSLAGELGAPLFTVVLEGLITKYMGETAAKLRLVFDAMERTTGVYLFDEVDALGGKRAASNDVGEIRRVLNTFLQLLESKRSESIVVAATNHPDLLDRALFRRFDDVIAYALPTARQVERVMRSRLAPFGTKGLSWKKATTKAGGLSYADITRACEDAAKETILEGRENVTTPMLLRALEERQAAADALGGGERGR